MSVCTKTPHCGERDGHEWPCCMSETGWLRAQRNALREALKKFVGVDSCKCSPPCDFEEARALLARQEDEP